MDNIDDFLERRRKDLAGRTAVLLRELAGNLNIETIERELHRITGTCGSYGLMEGSQGAAELLARIRDHQIAELATELRALAEVFTRSSEGGEN
ncbi:MAG: Hpt domain-containing protein [Ilumatobacteraceae bacterium]